jgi:hypothetical protein
MSWLTLSPTIIDIQNHVGRRGRLISSLPEDYRFGSKYYSALPFTHGSKAFD